MITQTKKDPFLLNAKLSLSGHKAKKFHGIKALFPCFLKKMDLIFSFFFTFFLRQLFKTICIEIRYIIGMLWDGRIRTSEQRDQNPLPYHLATPHFYLTLIKTNIGIGSSSIPIVRYINSYSKIYKIYCLVVQICRLQN